MHLWQEMALDLSSETGGRESWRTDMEAQIRAAARTRVGRRALDRTRGVPRLAFAAAALPGLCSSRRRLPPVEVGFSLTPSKTEPYAVCGHATPGHAACLAILVPSASAVIPELTRRLKPLPQLASPSYTGSGIGGGYDPADLRSAYDLPSESAGSGQTVAIVDAFDDPNAESDLGAYRSHYGLPACTTANGCFKKVNQTGGNQLSSGEPGWAVEISLDLDMVSAACPNCHILLVEAESNENANLYESEDEAVDARGDGDQQQLGRRGGPPARPRMTHTSITRACRSWRPPETAATGSRYPAASQYVIAVGGTALTQASNSRGWSETVWEERNRDGQRLQRL